MIRHIRTWAATLFLFPRYAPTPVPTPVEKASERTYPAGVMVGDQREKEEAPPPPLRSFPTRCVQLKAVYP